MEIKLYSTNCPRCKVLETKLKQKHINFELITDIEVMKAKGYLMAPMLEIGTEVFDFTKAIAWVNAQEVQI